jgi:hypothetical protein
MAASSRAASLDINLEGVVLTDLHLRHEKASSTIRLGSGLPGRIHWHLPVYGDTHVGSHWSWLPVLGVHADGDAW